MTPWSFPGLGQTLAVLQYKRTTEKSEQLQALKVLPVRFFPFIQSMNSFLNILGQGRIFEACLAAVTAFPAMYSESSLEKSWPTQAYPFMFKNGMWNLEKQYGVKEYMFKLLSKSLTTYLPIMLVIQLLIRINFSIGFALSSVVPLCGHE